MRSGDGQESRGRHGERGEDTRNREVKKQAEGRGTEGGAKDKEKGTERRSEAQGEAQGTDGAGDRVATKSGCASQIDPNNRSPPHAETWRGVGAALPVTMPRQGDELAAAEDRLSLFQSKCLHFSIFICILTEC